MPRHAVAMGLSRLASCIIDMIASASELGLPLGTYTHVTNLAQVYEPDMRWAQECVGDISATSGVMLPLPRRRSAALWCATPDRSSVSGRMAGPAPPVRLCPVI
jgi:hypothetical protein